MYAPTTPAKDTKNSPNKSATAIILESGMKGINNTHATRIRKTRATQAIIF